MPQNFHEMGEMILFAEERDLYFNVSVTRGPVHCSIADLPAARIQEIADDLLRQSEFVLPRLKRNRRCWEAEVARVQVWARLALEAEAAAETVVELASPTPLPVSAMKLEEARRLVGAFADDDQDRRIVVDPSERILVASPDLLQLLRLDGHHLVGAPLVSIRDRFVARFGPITAHTVVTESDLDVEAITEFSDASVLTCMAPGGSVSGVATSEMLFGVRSLRDA